MNAYRAMTPLRSTLWLFLKSLAPCGLQPVPSSSEHSQRTALPPIALQDCPSPSQPWRLRPSFPMFPLGIDSRLPVSSWVSPCSVTIFTASTFNSALYFRSSLIFSFSLHQVYATVSTETSIGQTSAGASLGHLEVRHFLLHLRLLLVETIGQSTEDLHTSVPLAVQES